MVEFTDDEIEREMYGHDIAPVPGVMNAMFNFTPDFVVKPKNAEEVSKIVEIAVRERMPIVPRGASTWGLGGAVPANGGILLDMSNMDAIEEIDTENMTATVQAGVTWKKLDKALLKKGLFLGAYPSSAPSATVGGWVSTGGVGIGTYKYGNAGDMLRSLEVVLPNGEIIDTGFQRVMSNAAGYNLNGLFVGAEGTLGVITKVTFKVVPAPPGGINAEAYTFPSMKALGNAMAGLSRSRITPFHVGYGDKNHYDMLAATDTKVAKGLGPMLTVTFEGDEAEITHGTSVMDGIARKNEGTKQPHEVAQESWDDRSYEFKARKVGIGMVPGEALVPMNKFNKMLGAIEGINTSLKMTTALIGSLPDRNSVMFMPYYLFDSEEKVKSTAAMGYNKKFADASLKLGGRPVGLGLFFAFYIHKMRDPGSVALMRAIKRAVDPTDIMNPGKTLEVGTGTGVAMPAPLMTFGMALFAGVKKVMSPDKYEGRFTKVKSKRSKNK